MRLFLERKVQDSNLVLIKLNSGNIANSLSLLQHFFERSQLCCLGEDGPCKLFTRFWGNTASIVRFDLMSRFHLERSVTGLRKAFCTHFQTFKTFMLPFLNGLYECMATYKIAQFILFLNKTINMLKSIVTKEHQTT